MIKSIKRGVFFDQKYWARHSKDGHVLKPIYFSSLITGNAWARTSKYCIRVSIGDRPKLKGMVRFSGQVAAAKRPAAETDTESEGESDSTGGGNGTPSVFRQDDRGEEGEQVRGVLAPGSFAT